MPSPDPRPTPTPARDHFAALQRTARPRRWLTATVLGAATGMLANLVLDWPHTPLVAIATVVGLLLWDHRHGTLASCWPTDEGLHRLAATTAHLERHGWTILPIPTTPPSNTHLLIGPGGVVVLEHQVWTITDTITTGPRSGLLHVGTRPAAQCTASVRATAATVHTALASHLPGEPPVRTILAIEGKTLGWPRMVAGVTIVPIADLARLLRASRTPLRHPEIAALTNTARRLFTPPQPNSRRKPPLV